MVIDVWHLHVQVEYLLCYAAAGTDIQFCALHRDDQKRVHKLGQPLNIATQTGMLLCFEKTMLIAGIMCAQQQQLPEWYQFLGGTVVRTNGVSITYMDGYIEKCAPAVDSDRLAVLVKLYDAVSGKPCIIQARDKPELKGQSYVVTLQPLGLAMLDPPMSSQDLCIAIR
jgi:hypothetical protein